MPITVRSGFWGTSYKLTGRVPASSGAARVFTRKPGIRLVKELMDTLLGAAVGATAVSTYRRRRGEAIPGSISGGGAVPMETVTVINRATTAEDLTNIRNILITNGTRPAYPRDRSGNGK